jgi:peptidoglycan/LPS O-acetylase OafA/YrhL
LRNRGLDILRAVAILLVLGRHGNGPVLWQNMGWVGVDLFFVLSGFLISGLLFVEYKKTGGINWKRFFIRRGFKIYPAFYAMILLTPLWAILTHRQIRWRLLLPEVLFYQSYQPNRVWAHTWSLAVEEHFYILLPALLLIMLYFQKKKDSGNPFRMIPVVCGVVGAACLIARSYLAHTTAHIGEWWLGIAFPTHLRIDSLFFGVLLGYFYHFEPEKLRRFGYERWPRLLLLACSLVLISVCFVFGLDSQFMLGFGLTALYLGFGGILTLVVCKSGEPAAGNKPSRWAVFGNFFAFIGMYSYSIYLWHPMVSQHLRDLELRLWPNISAAVAFCSYLLVSLFVGIVLSRLIEYPALHLRDRFFPSNQQPVKTN